MVDSTKPKLAFVSSATAAETRGLGLPQVALEELQAFLVDAAPLVQEVSLFSSDIAEIIFTSGTTGDLGATDQDGFLYSRGRKKDLIVLASGMNVYPEDIEARLRRHPAVAVAVVVGLPKSEQDVEVRRLALE